MHRIAITGPESVGKSTLSVHLAEHFGGAFVPEFARGYISNLGRPYNLNDVVIIAKQQIAEFDQAENFARNKKPFVFYDTYLIITKVWFNIVYKRCPLWLEEAIETKKMDLYLLCYPDLPWEADGVRENKNNRFFLFEQYKTILEQHNFKFEIISGIGAERTKMAEQKIKIHIHEQAKIPH